jgi:hypothetical protein
MFLNLYALLRRSEIILNQVYDKEWCKAQQDIFLICVTRRIMSEQPFLIQSGL